ncbi:golgi-body localization protein domain-containing protein [Cerioporus squamosus]|nr:golgi-body localization protein domain-containing protein [Cerioporus squamosus]
MRAFSVTEFFLHALLLRPLDDLTLWSTLLIWIVRLLTLSLLFRTYIGPAWLGSSQAVCAYGESRTTSLLPVRQPVSPYKRRACPSSWMDSPVRARIHVGRACVLAPPQSRLARRLWKAVYSLISLCYSTLEPYCRPTVRAFFVTILRLVIRALPAVTNGLDFELDSASVSLADIPGIRFSVGYAKLNSSVTLAYLPSVVSAEDAKHRAAHKRFASVADWNARVRGSFRRTWDRAWGATQVTASVTLQITAISGHVDKNSELFAGSHRGHYFLDVPGIAFSVGARLNPHQGVEPNSIATSLDFGKVNLQLDVIQQLLKVVKERRNVRDSTREAILEATGLSASPSVPSQASGAWRSPLSPVSPFMGALTASMRWRWAAKHSIDIKRPPRMTAKHIPYISYIKVIEVKVARVTASYQPDALPEGGPAVLNATLKDIALNAGLSRPGRSEIHQKWLGTGSGVSADSTADAYSVVFVAKQLALDRNGVGELMDHLRVATLKSLRWDSLISQWPSPWLRGTTFLAGDPNAQLLVSNLSLDTVEVTERLDMLERLARKERSPESVEKTVHGQPLLPPLLSPMPRVGFGVHIGDISLRLISPTSADDQEPFVLEAKTSGISGSCYGNVERDYVGLDMDFRYGLVVNRTYANVWFGPDAHMRASYPNETVIQVDSVHIGGAGCGLGEFADEAGGVVSIDVPSIYTNFQCVTDDISVELWQPDVIKALSCILARTTGKPSRRLLDQLPFGLVGCVSVGRFMIFMTSPDLAPEDTLNISRGLACRMGFSVSYSALRPIHCSRMSAVVARGDERSKLSLPAEQVLHASSRALVQVAIWDIVLRDALATPFAADDPYGVGDSSIHHRSLEFLHIENVDVHVAVSGERPNGLPLPNTMDDCLVEVSIPSVRAVMHLAQIYNALLAVHTVRSLLASRPPFSAPSMSRPPSPPTLRLAIQCHLEHLQLLWGFPLSSKMFMRISSLSCHISDDRKIAVDWDHILAGVNVPVARDGTQREEWEELVRLPRWHVELSPDASPLAIRIKGDSGRLRIPFDFVLADLILDINLTIKSVKHLIRMVAAGTYSDPPPPPEEDAKRIPNIHIDLGRLVVEAADERLEAQLGLIWKTGFGAAKVRQEREEAFMAKVATITSPKPASSSASMGNTESDFQFSSKHTVSVMDARHRLDQVHGVAWRAALHQARIRQTGREETHLQAPVGSLRMPLYLDGDMVALNTIPPVPPLVRLTFNQLSLSITPPSFPYTAIPDFLHEAGQGLPRDTTFSLLVPMHIHFTVASLRLTFREYPLPLLHIPPDSKGLYAGLDFDSDVVVAEEMGTDKSVEWVPCEIVKADSGMHGASRLSVRIPKTIMPVKSYARPTIRVMTDGITDFSWGVSYGFATQELMRVIDTLSHAPRDSSPAIGFWDKLRLVFHWRLKVLFRDEVHLHMKGSRDPYEIRGHGAGFALCWKGNPQLLIGQPNEANELIQVVSDSMLVIIPNIESSYGEDADKANRDGARRAQTICAKFRSGVCFGVGFVLERACGPECEQCSGKPFDRQCRLFNFKPHYDVKLEWKNWVPDIKSAHDSYNGFRSDFIHMSISLTSGRRRNTAHLQPSSLHLSPEVFAHFWSWWHLFNGALSLPIRQGKLYPRKRPISPKFGQHLATLKYLVSVSQVFISHVYVDDSQDAWADGVTPYVGVKALIDDFHADMHQRDTETTEATKGGTKTLHHKPFYTVEVVLKGLDLRAMLAVFPDPLKQCTPLEFSPTGSNYRTRNKLTPIDLQSHWVDMDDFAVDELDASGETEVYLLPTASCPRFTYFKRTDDDDFGSPDKPLARSKFGSEASHVCFIGKEPSIPQIQMELASERVERLRQKAREDDHLHQNGDARRATNDLPRMITLLQGYISQLEQVDKASKGTARTRNSSYYMPNDLVSPEEWAGFDNVYQVHSPHIIMDNAIRDIMMQYYYCSRSRRGFEYHMAQRAVKFIRDQAQAAVAEFHRETETHKGPAASAQAAAAAVKKLLVGDAASAPSVEFVPQTVSKLPSAVDPLHGWAEGVSARKGHFCLLLKPQIVLRSTEDSESVCVLAAVQGKLKTFSIMDDANANDPVSGKVMNRNFAWLTGLQTFSPSATNTSGKDYVPLEVLIDLRADNSDFDRLVPQTDATFQYDKFNRLRLRNEVTSVAKTSQHHHAHLQNQTDLVRLHVPRFTVSANDRHFQAISNIVTNLVLFTDAAHKTRAEKLEGLLFSYDFTNLASAADVVANMQQRLRQALETKYDAEQKLHGFGNPGRVELLKIDAHILLLVEELNLIFDAIKLAQDKANNESDQKSALLLHASSEEVSWRMLDQHDQLLAKLAVRDTDFYWLSRRDSSTVNNLAVGDLQAFDGAADAEWTEILSKYDEPSTHPLVKRKLFLLAHWVVLPPVGGITIYEDFDLSFHPMRLQIDIRVGRKIMEYLWPARRKRQEEASQTESFMIPEDLANAPSASNGHAPSRKSGDLPAFMYTDSPRHASFDLPPRKSLDANRLMPPKPPLRRLGTSRSFTDLRNSRQDSLQVPRIHRTNSSSSLRAKSTDALALAKPSLSTGRTMTHGRSQETDDAAEMKTRASQKTFVRVKVASLHLLLSIAKEDSFLCRDARIRTRDLEYRNQTWSFEELVDQFIPSGRNWRGWVKVAFQQPLVPVLPVARELITKTKWIASKKDTSHDRPSRPSTPKLLKKPPRSGSTDALRKSQDASRKSRDQLQAPPRMSSVLSDPPFLTSEPESINDATIGPKREGMRKRAISLFRRKSHSGKNSVESSDTTTGVFDHIMSIPRRPLRKSLSRRVEPETPVPGPSHRESHAFPPSSVHRHGDTYIVDGQQADLRVPMEDNEGLEGSRVNLAVEHMTDHEHEQNDPMEEHHHDDIVEHLDVIDPQVSTVSTLTNAMNAIVIPPLSFYSRKPVIVLPRLKKKRRKVEDAEKGETPPDEHEHHDALDQHVEDVLSKRDKFRRVMQGVWSFCKTPLGFITAIYGFLVVFWGTGIVFFLAKFINLHNDITQGFWVELCQQVETGLFTATSIGFIPFRVMDTYRICKIWHYKRKIAKLRQKVGLPELYDPDDLPDPVYDPNYVQVLTEKEQIDLHYQQHQFAKSQTWYRPHGTQTHRALALWICVCNDLNSFFQCLLSGTMWGLDRFARPAWTTGTTLPAAFVAGIIAGVLIYWGGRKTRRTEQVTDRLRMALEMDRENTAPGDASSQSPDRVEEAEEGPNGDKNLPTAETTRPSTETAASAPGGSPVTRDAEKGLDVPPVNTSQAQTQQQTQAMDRQQSNRSLQFADEMVVPVAEDIPRS